MKRKVEILVLSDIHLGSRACKAKELLNYLKSIKPQILILNGDIIDTTQLKTLPRDHVRVINRFMKMLANGTRIYYLTGQQDATLRRFSDFSSGNLFLRDQLVLKLGDKKYWFFHGDAMDSEMGISGFLSRFLSRYLGISQFLNSLFKTKKLGQSEKEVQQFEQKAVEMAHTEGYDAVVCGHVHIPKMAQHDDITYLNAGDWVENMSSLEYNFGEWSVYQYDTSDFDLINPKLHVKDLDLDEDEQKLVASSEDFKKQVLKKPNEYVVVRQRNTQDWIHNDAIWDGIEY